MSEWFTLHSFNQPISSMSHFVGAVVYLVLSVFLLHSAWHRRSGFWFAVIFALSAVTLLLLSGVYHMFSNNSTLSAVMVRLDVAAIFVLIAGTFTPIHGILFTGWRRAGILIPLWIVAIIGITLRTIFFDNVSPRFGTGIFLMMGWVGAFSSYLLWQNYRWKALGPLLAGGLMYTIGAVGNAINWPTIIPRVWGAHETFHVCVLAGLGFHWSFIAKAVDGSIQKQPLTPTKKTEQSNSGSSDAVAQRREMIDTRQTTNCETFARDVK